MTIFPVGLFATIDVSFSCGATEAPSKSCNPAAGFKGKKNEDSFAESSLNRYREIGAPELAQHALGAVLRPFDLDLPALHLENVFGAKGHANLASLAPLEIDCYDRLFFFGSLAFSHPDHFRSAFSEV
jgi:hypothetical protein